MNFNIGSGEAQGRRRGEQTNRIHSKHSNPNEQHGARVSESPGGCRAQRARAAQVLTLENHCSDSDSGEINKFVTN